MSNKTKKILVATGIYPPDIGGPSTYVLELKKQLPLFGWDPTVITYADALGQDDGVVRIVRNGGVLVRYARYFAAVWRAALNTDVVYAQGPVSEGLPACIAALLRGKPFILKVVGDYAWEQGTARGLVDDSIDAFQNKRYGLRVELMRFVEKMVARRAARIVVPSVYLKTLVSGWGIQGKKIEVIYNAVALPEKIQLVKTESQPKTLITVARLVPWKRMDKIIDAVVELLPQFSGLTLRIVGDGPEYAQLERKIIQNNLSGVVILEGKKSHDETLSLMFRASVFVLYSTYEGLSHVLVEAMSLGLPIVASDVGGNHELLLSYKRGILVSENSSFGLKESIEHALTKPSEGLTDGEQFSIRKRFSVSTMVKNLAEMLDVCRSGEV